jgi:D123
MAQNTNTASTGGSVVSTEAQYLAAVRDSHFDRYFDSIDQFSFRTQMLDLTPATAHALLIAQYRTLGSAGVVPLRSLAADIKEGVCVVCGDAFDCDVSESDVDSKVSDTTVHASSLCCANCRIPIDPNDASAVDAYTKSVIESNDDIRQTCTAIDDAIGKLSKNADHPQAFLRLSAMSPKDAVILFRDRFMKQLDTVMQTVVEPRNKQLEAALSDSFQTSENARIYGMGIASIEALKCTSAFDFIRLVLFSGRANQELKDICGVITTTQQQSLAPEIKHYIIVREWATFDVGLEFRAFYSVSRGVTAISVYNPFVYMPQVVAHKDSIRNLIVSFFETNQNILFPPDDTQRNAFDAYAFDVALVCTGDLHATTDVNESTHKVMLVERNMLNEATGTCLFDWHVKHDNDILFGRIANLEYPAFRIVEKVDRFVKHNMGTKWRQFI